MFFKKCIAYIIFFAFPLFLVIIGIFSGYFGVEFTKEILHLFGQISLWLLVLMLFSAYLSKMPLLSIIDSYKKEIGISSFLFAALHIIVYCFSISISNFVFEVIQRRYILLGFLLFLLMFVMFVTSFVNQKLFFRISPLLLPFSLLGALHYLFSTKVISLWAVFAFFILLFLMCIESIKNRRKI